MLIVSVVGARPQFVKLGPMHRAFSELSGDPEISHRVIHTGQHYDPNMSTSFFTELGIPTPDLNLGVGSGSHAVQTAKMMRLLEKAFMKTRPKLVLVYGDTNSTLAAALTAAKLHIAVAHVEAGLRSFRKHMPEEINRVVTDHLSTFLFCPTQRAMGNLTREGIAAGSGPEDAQADSPAAYQVGDVMKDAVDQNVERARAHSNIAAELDVGEDDYAVATVHRAENTDDPTRLREIAAALTEVACEVPVIVPLHPRTRKALEAAGVGLNIGSVRWIEPLPYLDMLRLVSGARLVLTDSGGLQKEAYLLGVPCVTLREETEWVELVHAGWNRLAGADRRRIVEAAQEAIVSRPEHDGSSLYGDGCAAKKIVTLCVEWCE